MATGAVTGDDVDVSKFAVPSSSSSSMPACVLVACGSFSPVTNFHLRLFEDARDALRDRFHVVGGVMSPVHDHYQKVGLVPFQHRLAMLQLAVEDSSWVTVSGWEGRQTAWTRTVDVLSAHKTYLEAVGRPARVLLVCGADLLDKFSDADVWPPDQVQRIVSEFGVAVMERTGCSIEAIVDANPLLKPARDNIFPVARPVVNDISSTIVRKLIADRRSIKYLVPDLVAAYIAQHNLYRHNTIGCV
ncbi:Nicotinamide-nucleotide adenylyltransferase [Plasmodiophora brassicae]